MRIGVLALQGDYAAHLKILGQLGVEAVPVRQVEQMEDIGGLIIPGGESTVMSRLCERYGLWDRLRELVQSNFPMLGTCAGMIFLANHIEGGAQTFPQKTLGALDIKVERNAYGAQLDSFETDVAMPLLGRDVRGVFIRAPRILEMGPGVESLAEHDGSPVIVRRENVWAVAFHPEICGEDGVHRLWLDQILKDPTLHVGKEETIG